MHPILRAVADRQFGAFASTDAVRAGCTPEDRLRDLDTRVLRVVRADLGPAWERVRARLATLLATPLTGPRRFTVVHGSVPSSRSA